MKNVFLVLALTIALVSALGGPKAGGVVTQSTDIDAETAQIISKTVLQVNEKHPGLTMSLDAVPTLLGKTTQVVNGVKKTFTFKYATEKGTEQVYYVEVWDAPWLGNDNKITMTCVAEIHEPCADATTCKNLALSSNGCLRY
mmetsp:Transcript_43835/g.50708  ORF Transcript_43835/g.50708 Transcript_43835/m.50708 type:complete len:142 (+) Transcript_43835:53-478(+)|eukprot:CAMPEP_0176431892 /NCGR_PEP_ID=MMETSP0127-20121128/15067_1 /TAXON_ID=938130 /ORGANISM="Platyophrya macrostoma, Strain WH" /LENGTH=141 /DNA_ID=CAMNT_0017813955 /DNA_START=58 /DNA_END=483 /DNA_ORIENTATION=-